MLKLQPNLHLVRMMSNLFFPSRIVRPIALIAIQQLAGCATLPPEAAKFNNFSDYAESVFKQQNQVISRMMMLNDSDQLPDSDELDEREQAMHDACHLLNEYAEKEIDGDFISPFFTRTVQNSIEGCDKSIHSVEQLIDQLVPAVEAPQPKSID